MKRTLLVVGVLFLGACVPPVVSNLAADCAASESRHRCTEQGAVRGGSRRRDVGLQRYSLRSTASRCAALAANPGGRAVARRSRRQSLRLHVPQIIGKEVRGEEDCLFINVWRPREMGTEPLPVMVLADRRWQS
mgnify:CR=1 FL=1